MKTAKISSQKVIGILKRDFFAKNGTDPISKVMFWKIISQNKIIKRLKRGEEILLNSGAKLIKSENNYFISGYAEDNHDVDCYFERR